MSMSKTAAIKATQSSISLHGRGTSWTLYGPYYSNDLGGPSTQQNADSYAAAKLLQARWRASLVCSLMGLDGDTCDYVIWCGSHSQNVNDLVNDCIRRSKTP